MRDRFKVRGSRFEEGPTPPTGEQGYMLLGLMVAIAIILLWLGVAASKAAFSIRRDREVETVRRGNQYVRAIREFYLKNGSHYPGSIEQLEKMNNVRFLRQRYIDPITGKDDWRLIVVGQNQTTVKGFFGEELQGLPNAGLGSAAGLASGFGGTPAPTAVSGTGQTSGGAGAGGTGAGGAGAGGTGQGTGGLGSAGSAGGLGGFGFGSGTGTSMGPIMGVGLNATGNSLLEPNQQTTYQTWEFLYDPRIELLKVKQALNQGLGSAGTGALGQTPGGFGQSNGLGQSNGFGQSNGLSPNGTSTPTGTGQAPGGFPTQP